jgi:hypothetical protein
MTSARQNPKPFRIHVVKDMRSIAIMRDVLQKLQAIGIMLPLTMLSEVLVQKINQNECEAVLMRERALPHMRSLIRSKDADK